MLEKLDWAAKFGRIIIFAIIAFLLWQWFRDKIRPTKAKSLRHVPKKMAHGIIFGRARFGRVHYSPTDDEGACFVIGGSGSGKTSALLIPTLRSWTGTSLVIDISGDIEEEVDCPNKLVFDPTDPSTVPYNIFAAIDALPNCSQQDEALENLAWLLMPEERNANANAKYFQDGGRNMLTAALIAFYHQGVDFCKICEFFIEKSAKELLSAIDQTENRRVWSYISQFVDSNEANTQGCKQNADNAIRLFAVNDNIMSAVHRGVAGRPFFAPMTIETHNIFIKIPDQKLKVYSPLLRIIVAQSLNYLGGRPNGASPTVLLALDEFHSLGRLEIAEALQKFRKKRVRIMVLTQSLYDIDDIYGQSARKAMLDNFRYKVILEVNGVEAQEYFARMIGREKKPHESVTSSEFSIFPTSRTTSYVDGYTIEPHELAHLDNELILIHPDGWTKMEKNYYYKE